MTGGASAAKETTMPRKLKSALVLLPLLACCGLAAADNGLYARENDGGTIELTNVPDNPDDYRVVVAPTPPPAAAAAPLHGQPAETTEQPSAPPTGGNPFIARLRALYDGAHAAHEAAGH